MTDGVHGADTDGPWHHGQSMSGEVLGNYVTIICGNPDVIEAIFELCGDPRYYKSTQREAIVGVPSWVKRKKDEAAVERVPRRPPTQKGLF